MTLKFNHEISLETIRCRDCHLWFAVVCPEWRCPYCASVRVAELIDKQFANERTISALRGALTKAKRK